MTSNWSRGEKAAWKDICHPPAVLVTNDESYWKVYIVLFFTVLY
jgi:hypothetical protein